MTIVKIESAEPKPVEKSLTLKELIMGNLYDCKEKGDGKFVGMFIALDKMVVLKSYGITESGSGTGDTFDTGAIQSFKSIKPLPDNKMVTLQNGVEG